MRHAIQLPGEILPMDVSQIAQHSKTVKHRRITYHSNSKASRKYRCRSFPAFAARVDLNKDSILTLFLKKVNPFQLVLLLEGAALEISLVAASGNSRKEGKKEGRRVQSLHQQRGSLHRYYAERGMS